MTTHRSSFRLLRNASFAVLAVGHLAFFGYAQNNEYYDPYPNNPDPEDVVEEGECPDCESCETGATSDCSECSETPGSGGEESSSVRAAWSLGFVTPPTGPDYRRHVPRLVMWQEEITPAIYTRSVLRIEERQNAGVIYNTIDGQKVLRQIRTVNGLTDIRDLSAPQQGFEIRFFRGEDAGVTPSGGLYQIDSGAIPLRTVVVKNPDSSTTSSKVDFLSTLRYGDAAGVTKLTSFERTAGTPGGTTTTHLKRYND